MYSYIQSQMPQGRGGSLATNIYVTSTVYILQQNGFPAGEEALEPGSARLGDLPLRRAVTTDQPNQQSTASGGQGTPNQTQPGGSQADGSQAANAQTGGTQSGGSQTESGGGGSSVAAAQAQVGDLRLSVLPAGAQVVVTSPADYRQTRSGGSYLLGGLEPGAYTVTATFEGQQLERTVEVTGGEVVSLELTFSNVSVSDAPVNALRDTLAGITTDGGQLYAQNCTMCHGAQGGGGLGPALSSNPRLAADAWVIERVAEGGLGMPAFGKELAPQELAAVTSYVRTHFGNAYGEVTPQQVRRVVANIPPAQLSPAVSNLEAAPLGQQRYTQLCSACHGLQGGGGVGPPLAGNPTLQNEQLVVTTILYGRGIMPAFSLYSDTDIAAISSYIRGEWGNAYSPLAPAQVQSYRPERTQP